MVDIELKETAKLVWVSEGEENPVDEAHGGGEKSSLICFIRHVIENRDAP